MQLLGGQNIRSPSHFSYWEVAAPPRPPTFYASCTDRVCQLVIGGYSVFIYKLFLLIMSLWATVRRRFVRLARTIGEDVLR